MANMSAKFDEEAHNGLVSMVFTMANMSAKFDEEAHNGLVSMVFTSLFPYMSIVTLTFDLQNQ